MTADDEQAATATATATATPAAGAGSPVRHYQARPVIGAVTLPTVSKLAATRRAGRVASTVARHFATMPVAVARDRRGRGSRGNGRSTQVGPRLRGTTEDLGATYVKLGQLLASSPSLAGETLSDALRGLLDDGPGISVGSIRRIFERDTGLRFDQVFATFDPKPHAAASLAVVHKATLADGTPVAVKVLRPQTYRLVAEDLSIIQPLFGFLARQVPLGVVSSLPETVAGLAEQLTEELDLRNEARSMDWFRNMVELIGAQGVIVPRSFAHASGRRVLTMEFIEGRPVDDLGAIEEIGFDAKLAVQRLLQAWFAVTLCTGTFHGDMHAGNLLFTDEGEVVLLDWGILGRLDPASRKFFRRCLEAAMGDETAWDDVRTHLMPTVGTEMGRLTGLPEDDIFEMIKGQIAMIMTEPFSSLNVMALVPQLPVSADGTEGTPDSLRDWVRLARRERRRLRDHGTAPPPAPDRSELLLVKQLIYFERYGKLFLGDQPLIWDTEIYKTLLALPQDDPTGPANETAA